MTDPLADLFRREAGRLHAILVARYGAPQLPLVEDAVQDAMVAAIRRWPRDGWPANPRGWLFRTACNALIDRMRRARFERVETELVQQQLDARPAELDLDPEPDTTAQNGAQLYDDELLRLIAYCCAPELPAASRLTLTLRYACGLGIDEIARALLCEPSTIAQRLVRAKRELRSVGVVPELPDPESLDDARLDAMLQAIYLLFDAGYLNERGADWLRPALCEDAVRLARLLATHSATSRPSSRALAALLCLCAARLPARIDADGRPVTLERQDRALWRQDLVSEGFRHLASSIAGEVVSRYHIEASIAAVHARAARFEDTDWAEIVSYYDQLCLLYPSPVATLNRAIAAAQLGEPAAAMQSLRDSAAIRGMHGTSAYHATVAHLHEALGERDLAARAYRDAAAASQSPAMRELLLQRAEISEPR